MNIIALNNERIRQEELEDEEEHMWECHKEAPLPETIMAFTPTEVEGLQCLEEPGKRCMYEHNCSTKCYCSDF